MFPRIDGERKRHISSLQASRVLDVANAAYGLMLRLLASGFSLSGGTDQSRLVDDKRAEVENAITVMGIVKSLAVFLTTLPANLGSNKAGMNFHLPRSTLALPQRSSGKVLLAERAGELAQALERLALDVSELDKGLAKRMGSVADTLAG